MKILSVFCDESGDFGASSDKNAYYLVTMIYHDQNIDLSDEFQKYDEAIARTGFNIEYVHTGPIIRREEVFADYTIDERRKLLYKILNLYNSCDIRQATICVPRKEAPDKVTLSGKLARQMKIFLTRHETYFCAYDKVIVYYDNGQSELSAILNAVFSMYFAEVEFRKAEQQNYRLLQIADFICSMELLNIKRSEKRCKFRPNGVVIPK